MRLLANENLPREAVAALRQAGHEVEWVRVDAPGARDDEVLARAESEERILIAFDKDFGELAYGAHPRATKGIILLRISAPPPGAVSKLIVTALSTRQDWAGHFSVIADDRIRMSSLPMPGQSGGS